MPLPRNVLKALGGVKPRSLPSPASRKDRQRYKSARGKFFLERKKIGKQIMLRQKMSAILELAAKDYAAGKSTGDVLFVEQGREDFLFLVGVARKMGGQFRSVYPTRAARMKHLSEYIGEPEAERINSWLELRGSGLRVSPKELIAMGLSFASKVK